MRRQNRMMHFIFGRVKAPAPKTLAYIVASCFVPAVAHANPVDPNVVNGAATFTVNGNTLTIQNTPGAIINWQGFSINANEITRFLQQSASSAVLNRVLGADPSVILGALQSNGRVFLINPNGIVFGAGAQVDVAGLVASSLNLSNQDFLAGRLKFTGDGTGGQVVNSGNITTGSGGSVYLIAENVENNGIITSPNGEVVLAAGHSVELVNAGSPNLRVEITADNNKAVNLGKIIADAGNIGVYGALVQNSGTISANSAVAEGGHIYLKATQNVTVSGTVSADGVTNGGTVTIQAGADSGDTALVQDATISAKGNAGIGGTVEVLGNQVGLIGNTTVDVSGATGGGTALIGGDEHGSNPDIPNAYRTYVDTTASIVADAINAGSGGKVVVWSDDATRFYGNISAQGGANGGDGGFSEVSGANYLDFQGLVNLSAVNGVTGTLLLDPSSVTIGDGIETLSGGSFGTGTGPGGPGDDIFGNASDPAYIRWDTIDAEIINANVVITTTGSGSEGDITIESAHTLYSANDFTLLADNDITIGGAVELDGGGSVRFVAGWDEASTATPAVTTGTGNINLNADLTTSGGNITLTAGGDITLDGANVIVYGDTTHLNPTVTATAGGALTVDDSTIEVYGSNNTVGDGGNATIALTAGTLSFDNAYIDAEAGYGRTGNGGTANITLTATGADYLDVNDANVSALTITDGSGVYADGGEGNGIGGNASVQLNANAGSILLANSDVEAYGGDAKEDAGGIGGAATVALNASGDVALSGSGTDSNVLAVYGGDGGESNGDGGFGETVTSGAGGAATLNITAGGKVWDDADNPGNVMDVEGGAGYTNGGSASLTIDGGEINLIGGEGTFYSVIGGYNANEQYNGDAALIITTLNTTTGTGNIELDGFTPSDSFVNGAMDVYGKDISADITAKGDLTIDYSLLDIEAVSADSATANFTLSGANVSIIDGSTVLVSSGGVGTPDGVEDAVTNGVASNITVNATAGDLTIDDSVVVVIGGDGAYGGLEVPSATNGGNGGNAGISLIATGSVSITNDSDVEADAGYGGDGGEYSGTYYNGGIGGNASLIINAGGGTFGTDGSNYIGVNGGDGGYSGHPYYGGSDIGGDGGDAGFSLTADGINIDGDSEPFTIAVGDGGEGGGGAASGSVNGNASLVLDSTGDLSLSNLDFNSVLSSNVSPNLVYASFTATGNLSFNNVQLAVNDDAAHDGNAELDLTGANVTLSDNTVLQAIGASDGASATINIGTEAAPSGEVNISDSSLIAVGGAGVTGGNAEVDIVADAGISLTGYASSLPNNNYFYESDGTHDVFFDGAVLALGGNASSGAGGTATVNLTANDGSISATNAGIAAVGGYAQAGTNGGNASVALTAADITLDGGGAFINTDDIDDNINGGDDTGGSIVVRGGNGNNAGTANGGGSATATLIANGDTGSDSGFISLEDGSGILADGGEGYTGGAGSIGLTASGDITLDSSELAAASGYYGADVTGYGDSFTQVGGNAGITLESTGGAFSFTDSYIYLYGGTGNVGDGGDANFSLTTTDNIAFDGGSGGFTMQVGTGTNNGDSSIVFDSTGGDLTLSNLASPSGAYVSAASLTAAGAVSLDAVQLFVSNPNGAAALDVSGSSVSITDGSELEASGGTTATVSITSTSGDITIDGSTNSNFVEADGDNGGEADVILNSAAGITVIDSYLDANGGYNNGADGGIGKVSLTSADNVSFSRAYLNAYGGSADSGAGGEADIEINAGGQLDIDTDDQSASHIFAQGGSVGVGGETGGLAYVHLVADGFDIRNAGEGGTIQARGGDGLADGGDAMVLLTSNSGDIALTNAGVSAQAGISNIDGNGGVATVEFDAGAAGNVSLYDSYIGSAGGDGAGNGAGGNAGITLNAASGTITVNGDYSDYVDSIVAQGGAGTSSGAGGKATIAFDSSGLIDIDDYNRFDAYGGTGRNPGGSSTAGSAAITLTSSDAISVIGNSDLRAYGGDSDTGAGAKAGITLDGASITLANGLYADGGEGDAGAGGDATVTLTADDGIDAGASYLHAGGGKGDNGLGGDAGVIIDAGTGAFSNSGGTVEADGGESTLFTGGSAYAEVDASSLTLGFLSIVGGNGTPQGDATLTLDSTGALTLSSDLDVTLSGGNVAFDVTSGGLLTLDNIYLDVEGVTSADVELTGVGVTVRNGGTVLVEADSGDAKIGVAGGSGAVNIIGASYLNAYGGTGHGSKGGDATIALSGSSLTVDGGEYGGDVYVYASGGDGESGGDGGAANITWTGTGGAVQILNGGIEADGGYSSSGTNGAATIALNSDGGDITLGGNYYAAGIVAYGGGSFDEVNGAGGDASITLNAGSGAINLTGTTGTAEIYAEAGSNYGAVNAGNASVALNTTGDVSGTNSEIVAYGGYSESGSGNGNGGNATVAIGSSGAPAGAVTLNQVEIFARGGSTGASDSGSGVGGSANAGIYGSSINIIGGEGAPIEAYAGTGYAANGDATTTLQSSGDITLADMYGVGFVGYGDSNAAGIRTYGAKALTTISATGAITLGAGEGSGTQVLVDTEGTSSADIEVSGASVLIEGASELYGYGVNAGIASTVNVASTSGTIVVDSGTELIASNDDGSAGTLTLTSAGDVTLTNNTVNASQLTVTGDNITVDGGEVAIGALGLNASGDLLLTADTAALTITASGIAALVGNNVSIGDTNAGYATDINVGGVLTIGATANLNVIGGSADGAHANVTGGSGGVSISLVNGDVNVTGGSGSTAYAKIAGTGTGASDGVLLAAPAEGDTGINNVNITGGSGAGAYATIFGTPEVNATVQSAINIAAGSGSGAYARIEAGAPTTINVDFPTLASGGYTVDGAAQTSSASTSGFYVGDNSSSSTPAVLNTNLFFTYGLAAPGAPGDGGSGGGTPPIDDNISALLQQASQYIYSVINTSSGATDQNNTGHGSTGTEHHDTQGDDTIDNDKNNKPVCS